MEIGFSLYNELLERTVNSLKTNTALSEDNSVMRASEIDFHIPALIPDDYIIDVHRRLIEYKRISSAKSKDEIRDLQIELIDRFGLLPDSLKNLFQLTQLKLYCSPIGIDKIDFGEQSGRITFNKNPAIDHLKALQLVQSKPTVYGFDGQDTIKLNFKPMEFNEKIIFLTETLAKIKQH